MDERTTQLLYFLGKLEKQSRDFPRAEEVAQAIKVVFDLVSEMRKTHLKEMNLLGDGLRGHMGKEIKNALEAMGQAHSTVVAETRQLGSESEKRHAELLANGIEKATTELSSLLDPLHKRLSQVEERKIPLVPKDLVNKSDLTSEVQALRDEFKKELSIVKDQVAKGGVRRVYQPYIDDFTSHTDGAKKTFTLSREPLKTDTILVWGTDFPIILRPTTDFTVAGKVLTLTSQVPAPSSGATLLIQYHA